MTCGKDHNMSSAKSGKKKPGRRLFEAARWLPNDRKIIINWIAKKLPECKKRNPKRFAAIMKHFPSNQKGRLRSHEEARAVARESYVHGAVRDLAELYMTRADFYMFFEQMYEEQIPDPPAGGEKCDNFGQALGMIDVLMAQSPEYDASAPIPVPINAVLNLPMGTPAGCAAFTNREVNVLFKNLLDDWESFLETDTSKYVLADVEGGWFTPEALTAMGYEGDINKFAEDYTVDTNDTYMGYTSFDDFFARKFTNPDESRPVGGEGDNKVVVCGCEAAVVNNGVTRNVDDYDTFWIKGDFYSMRLLLNNNEEKLNLFRNGIIFQGFLSPTTYHRFHSPVKGTIESVEEIPGFYYSVPYYPPDVENDPDNLVQLNDVMNYLPQTVARKIVYIQCDNSDIGLMAFIPLGMSDVSTIEITKTQGDPVEKGEDIGSFHFGGSSYVMLFRDIPGLNFVAMQPNQMLDVRSTLCWID